MFVVKAYAEEEKTTSPPKEESSIVHSFGTTLGRNPNKEKETLETTELPQNYYESNFSWWDYASAISTILFMLFLLYGLLWFIRKYTKVNMLPYTSTFSKKDLKVEAQLALAPKKTLYVVKYLNKRLLLGSSEQGLSLLSEDYLTNEERELEEAYEREMQAQKERNNAEAIKTMQHYKESFKDVLKKFTKMCL